MNRIPSGEGACEKIRRYLDSYVTNELLVETNHEVLRHIEGCPACASGSALTLVFQPGGNSSRTSCCRGAVPTFTDAEVGASVMNVGAPFNIAKSASTQFDRTVISWQYTR